MADSNVQLASAAIVAVSAILGAGSFFRYQWQANRNRSQDLANLKAQESIRDAVYNYHARYGTWPKDKKDLLPLVRFKNEEMKWIRAWDCRLKSADRKNTTARYAILVGNDWIEWDAKTTAPLHTAIS